MLTKGLDNVPGTAGNDTIIGSVEDPTVNVELNTLSALDIVNGGAGIDTLKIATNLATAVPLANISNVEIVEVQGAIGVIANASTLTGVTNLNVTKAGGTVLATAAATTDVSVAMKAVGATVGVVGGKNVSVKLSDVAAAADVVTIGAGTAPKGDVTVEMTGKAATATATLSAVNVTGGKTVSVTQKATSDASAIATNKVAATITQGAVTVTGNADTTTVTVKQDATVNAVAAADAVAAKAATQEVTFSAMTKGQILSLDFGAGALTFTANKDLTAAEAASAFANLAAGAKQGNAAAAFGIYTDATAGGATAGVTDGWTSGAVQTVSATAAKVVFSNSTATAAGVVNPAAISNNALVTTATAPGAGGLTAGTAVVAAKTGVLGVANGAVGVTDGANSIKTITVDGYGTSTTTATTVLETLNLSNSGLTYAADKVTGVAGFTVADTAATLALNLEKVGFSGYYNNDAAVTTAAGVVALTLAPTTLNVKSTGNNYVNLTADLTETLNVSGTGLLNASTSDLLALKTVKVTETAGLTLNTAVNNTVTSVDTTGTTGTVTVTINGDQATYAGGAGVDKVTVANANNAISKAIDLGAGDDTLTLAVTAGNVAVPTVEVKGGDGIDTIAMSGASAVALSANGDLAAKISGFEKLGINTAVAGTVDMSNMDGISYAISANSVAAAAQTESNAITFQNLAAGQSVTVDGLTLTATGGAIAANAVAAGFASLLASATTGNAVVGGTFTGALSANWTSGTAGGAAVTFTSTTPNADVANLATVVNAAGTTPVDVVKNDATVNLDESALVTFTGAANGATVTVAGKTLTVGAASMSAAEVEAAFATGASAKGTFDTPTFTGWSLSVANGNDGDGILSFTSTTLGRNVTDIALAGNASAATTQGYAASTLTFQDLAIGQSVTVDGLTLTATTAAITAANVATGFASQAASGTGAAVAGGTFTGALSANWASQAAAGAAVEFRSATAGTLEAALVVTDAGVAAGTALGNAATPQRRASMPAAR